MPKLTRDDTLSCSQLPALMGENPWATPNDVMQALMDGAMGKPRQETPNEAMEWGNRVESAILSKMAEALGATDWFSPTEPFYYGQILGASLDGLCTMDEPLTFRNGDSPKIYVMTRSGEITISGTGCLEAKNTKAVGSDEPALYRGPLQLQGQMMCADMQWGAIGTLHQGHDFRLYLYDRDHELTAYIEMLAKDVASRMQTFMETGQAEWYDIKSNADALRAWPEAKHDKMVDITPFEDDVSVIVDAKAQIALLERSISDAELRIKQAMENAETGETQQFIVRWPMRNYKASPEKIVPAKDAYSVRQQTLVIKEKK
ncbi:MAG: YqaJ viral recombinase family protein [Methylococcaceae bacterium]